MKPLAVMIKNAYSQMIFYSICMVLFGVAAVIVTLVWSIWGLLFFIPCAFFGWVIYGLEKEIDDYLVSI